MSHKSSPNFSIHDPHLEIRALLEQSAILAESKIGVKMSRSQVIRFLAMQFINSSDRKDV